MPVYTADSAAHFPWVHRLPPEDQFKRELGERIDQAWVRAGYDSRAEMLRHTEIKDANQAHKWAKGRHMPKLDGLAMIALACNVSLDWLVFGREEAPAFLEWLETPAGLNAPEEAKEHLRSIAVRGYLASVAYYDLAYQAWKLGLTKDLSREQVAQMAIDTHRQS